MTPADTVPSYASRALRLWAAGDRTHSASRCPCLVCADGRVYLGHPPLPVMIGGYTMPALPVGTGGLTRESA